MLRTVGIMFVLKKDPGAIDLLTMRFLPYQNDRSFNRFTLGLAGICISE